MEKILKQDFTIWKFNFALYLRSLMLLSPIVLLFYNEHGLNANDLFFCQGIFYIFAILFDIPVGYFSNTRSRKHLLIVAFTIFMVMSLLWLFFKGYYIIITGEILYALTKTILDNVPSSYMYDYLATQNKQMSKYWGYSNFFMSFGIATGALLGAFLYEHFGSTVILIIQCFLIGTCIFLISTLPNVVPQNKNNQNFFENIQNYISTTKEICNNKSIIYYIILSGLFNALSYLFALGFQPVMKNSLFPIALFGAIHFITYFVKAGAGIIVGKWLKNLHAHTFIIPLYILFLAAFFGMFVIFTQKNILLNFTLMTLICLIIGIQIIFLILHISRLHSFVPYEGRGSLMTINNNISRLLPAIFLITSKLFITNENIHILFIVIFIFYLTFGSFITLKAYKIKD